MVVAATKQTGARTYLWVPIACNRPVWSEEKWTGWDLNPECLRTMARCLFTSRYLSATPQIRTHDLDFASWSSSRSQRSELTQSRQNRALARTATITLRSCRAFLPLFLRGSQRPSDIPGSRLNRFL